MNRFTWVENVFFSVLHIKALLSRILPECKQGGKEQLSCHFSCHRSCKCSCLTSFNSDFSAWIPPQRAFGDLLCQTFDGLLIANISNEYYCRFSGDGPVLRISEHTFLMNQQVAAKCFQDLALSAVFCCLLELLCGRMGCSLVKT